MIKRGIFYAWAKQCYYACMMLHYDILYTQELKKYPTEKLCKLLEIDYQELQKKYCRHFQKSEKLIPEYKAQNSSRDLLEVGMKDLTLPNRSGKNNNNNFP